METEGRTKRPAFWLLSDNKPFALLGPAWAALCGAVASGNLTFDGKNLLSLFLTLFLADQALGALWELIAGRDWFALLKGPSIQEEEVHSPSLAPPYTVPGSPSEKMFNWLGREIAWWRTTLKLQMGSTLLSIVVILPLTMALAIVIGWRAVVLTSAGLALIALALLLRRRGSMLYWPKAVLEIGLSWLIGHTAFCSLDLVSFLLASFYTGAYYARLVLASGGLPNLFLLNGSQALVISLLVLLNRPIPAGIVGMLLLPQMMLQPFLRKEGLWYLHRTRMFLIASMAIAALAI
jgi:hypothetical protein